MSFLYGVNFCLSFLMALMLWFRKQALIKADYVLITYMGYVAFVFLLLAISNGGLTLPLVLKALIGGGAFTLFASLFLSYIIELVGKPVWWHGASILPAFVHVSLQGFHTYYYPEKYSFLYGLTIMAVDDVWQGLMIATSFAVLLLYPVIGSMLVTKYRANILARYSDMTELDVSWIIQLLMAMILFLILASLIAGPFQYLFDIPLEVSFAAFFVGVSVMHFYIGWRGLDQRKADFVEVISDGPTNPSTPDTLRQDAAELADFMERTQLFLRASLTLQELATMIDWPGYKVSETIRDGYQRNFYDFVNGYRVEEVKKLMADPKNASVSLLSLAFDAGFNSKTAFNTVFKKKAGVPPSVYRTKIHL